MNENNRDDNDDDYKLPPGIILPQDSSSDYPDWKKGILSGIPCGIFSALVLAAPPLSKTVSGKIGLGIVGFLMGFLMVGALVAFRPPRN